MVVCKDDAGSGQGEVVRRNVRRQIVGSKAVPHEYDDSSSCRARLLLLRSHKSRHCEQHARQENQQPYVHGPRPSH
jgi:hypothetical protein